MARATYRCLDHRFTIDCDDDAAQRRIGHLLVHWRDDDLAPVPADRYTVLVEATRRGPWFHISRDDEDLAVGPDFEACFHHLLWHLTTASQADASDRLFVHAGAVVAPGGGAILLPGPSGAGKTTLTAALVLAGAALLSDEAAVVDLATAEIVPFARPLAFEPDAASVLPELGLPATGAATHLAPDDVRVGAVGRPSPVALVVAPHRVARVTCEVQPLTAGETVLVLAEQTSDLVAHGTRGLAALAAIARRAAGFRLLHGDRRDAVRLVLERRDRTTRCVGRDVDLRAAPGAPTHSRDRGALRRAPGLVEEQLGDETVVLDRDGRVHLLDPTTTAIWRTIGRVPAVADRAPVGEALEALQDAGLVIRQ